MAGYCTSGQMYFREPKASEKTAHKYNIQPYSTFTSVIIAHFLCSHKFYQLPQCHAYLHNMEAYKI